MDPSITPPPAGPTPGQTPGPAAGPTPGSPAGPNAGTTRPPLRRPREGRVLAGIAAGIADHLGMDVALVRLLIVVVTIVTQGFGVLVYLVAIFVIPAAEPGAPRATAAGRDPSMGSRSPAFWGGIAMLVIGVWWLVAVTPLRFGFLPGVSVGSLAAPLLLIGVGLALWVTGDRAGANAPAAPWAAAPVAAPAPPVSPVRSTVASPTYLTTSTHQEPAMTPTDTSTPGQGDTVPPASAVPPAGAPPATTPPSSTPPTPPAPPAADGEGWTPPPAPERSGGLLSRATIGLLLVTVGLLWSLRLAGAITISGGQLLAAGLLVVGLGLLVGAFAGRGRGLIWLGAVLLPLVLIAQIPGSSWIQTVPSFATSSESGTAAGELRLAPTDLADLQDSYEIGAGSIRLDLTELDFDGADVEVEISVGAGEIRVIVPDDVDLAATASIGIGEIRMLERRSGGIGVGDLEVTSQAPGQAAASVELELSAGIGNIRVEQAAAARP